MMTRNLPLLIFLMLCVEAHAKRPGNTIKIDTLGRLTDTVIARISNYDGDILTYTEEAFLIPDTILVTRYLLPKILPHLRTGYRTMVVSHIIRHGQLNVFEKDGRRTTQVFSYGNRVKAEYWSSDNRLITRKDYYGGILLVDGTPFEESTNRHYILLGTKAE